jgi:PAS domain S-box-containing protein
LGFYSSVRSKLPLANDAIFIRNAADNISYWNEGAERLYGWASGEVLGRSVHGILRTEFPGPLSEILQTDRWEGELRHTTKYGTQITIASRWTTLRDQNGKSVGWLEINTDITARKRAEEAAWSLSGRILTLQE